jgi:hypothetical protein
MAVARPAAAETGRRRARRILRSLVGRRWLIVLPLAVSFIATVSAMRRTSATFDEIVLIAGGARGLHTGAFDLAPDHPPLLQYIYGLPVYLSAPHYPAEEPVRWSGKVRYVYARLFFWGVGNDAQALLFRARLVAAILAAGLVLLTWAYARRAAGPVAGLLAGTLVAFLPDVLAHGGVAYGDVPVALLFLAGLWAIDEAAREPGPARAGLAGLLCALAVGVKFSAILLAPAMLLVLLVEALARRLDRAWLLRLAAALAVALVAMYLGLVAIYRGDLALEALRIGIGQQMAHVDAAGGAPNFLLGRIDYRGWWYFYPVAFLFKTPVALHLLVLAAVAGFARSWPGVRRAMASRLRVAVIGGLVFGAALLGSHLDIGFRYSLPVLPLLCVLTAAGVVRLWRAARRPALRYALAAVLAWDIVAPLTAYPWFLSYLSEYSPGRDAAYEVLVDSNIDWGQGLLALHDFMRERGISSVYLSYFGSALPEGYGIDYVPLGSFFPLPARPEPETPPTWIVVSATCLQPLYFDVPAFARLRRARPDAVIGGSLYAYRLR